MAQARAFGQDEQGNKQMRSDTALAPSRGTGGRAAAFVGGDIDATTGNITPGSTQQAKTGFVVTGTENPPPPPPPVPEVVPEPSRVQSIQADSYAPPPAAAAAPAAEPTAMYRNDKSNVAEQVGKWFCYGSGTPILMEDGSWKMVEALRIGDRTALGGMVTARGEALAERGTTAIYRDQIVSDAHAVFHEGSFHRVGDIEGLLRPQLMTTVFPIATENRLLVTKTHIGADFTECQGGHDMTPVQRLSVMNREVERLRWLAKQELELIGLDANA